MAKELFDIEPLVTDPKYGREPSLRNMVRNYYQPHFPETYKEMAEEYLEKIIQEYNGDGDA